MQCAQHNKQKKKNQALFVKSTRLSFWLFSCIKSLHHFHSGFVSQMENQLQSPQICASLPWESIHVSTSCWKSLQRSTSPSASPHSCSTAWSYPATFSAASHPWDKLWGQASQMQSAPTVREIKGSSCVNLSIFSAIFAVNASL